jgi:hypothetical protein
MKPIRLVDWAICTCLALAGCGDGKSDPKAEAPPALKVQSAAAFVLAGATAIGVGTQLIPTESIEKRQAKRIHELAVRFSKFVREARLRLPPRREVTVSASHISAVKCEKP